MILVSRCVNAVLENGGRGIADPEWVRRRGLSRQQFDAEEDGDRISNRGLRLGGDADRNQSGIGRR